MARFVGAVAWRAAARREPSWSAVLEVLGPGALDCSPAGGTARLGHWAPGATTLGPRSLASSAEATVLFAGYLRDLPPGCPGEADFVLGRYRDGDWSWLPGANGVFALAAVDHREPRCALAVDRLGMRPLLFASDGAGVAFGTDLGAVAACRPPPRAIDHDALEELVAVGFPLGDRTALRGVERVPPGSWLALGPGGRRSARYWSIADLPSPRPQSPEAFVDESRPRLRAAIVRLAAKGESPPLCLLSTGYDSRRILLEGHAAGVRFETLTAAWPHARLPGTSIEPTVIGELCRRLGAPGRLVPAVGPAEQGDVGRDRQLRDALLDFTVPGRDHLWAVPLLAELPRSPGRVSFDGIAGDTFFNNPFYELPRTTWGRWRADDDVIAAIAPEHRFWDGVWRGLTSRPLADRVRDALDALPEGPARLSYLYLLGRTRRVPALLPFGLFDLRLESVCPYLDHEVMDHAWTFDPVRKAELQLQRVALDRHFPDFAGLPSSHSSAAEVAERYRVPTDFANPDAPRRFAGGDVARILGRWRGEAEPRAPARDVAFAGLSAVGLGRLGGSWREERLRRLLHALAAVDHLGRADASRIARARRASLAWLARRVDGPGRASMAL